MSLSSLLGFPHTSLLGLTESKSQSGGSDIKHVLLIANEVLRQVAPDSALHPGGISYDAMTFNGTIPSPVISIDEGDTLEITLRNEGQTIHSVDFHVGYGSSGASIW